jgi:hypothetical protein
MAVNDTVAMMRSGVSEGLTPVRNFLDDAGFAPMARE